MTEHELGKILKEKYDNAPSQEHVAQIHLFGIQYASHILASKFSSLSIITESGLPKSYATELRKGVNLSKYLKVK
jgi:hypothetical protein